MFALLVICVYGDLYNYVSWYNCRTDLGICHSNSFSTADPTLKRSCITEGSGLFKDPAGIVYRAYSRFKIITISELDDIPNDMTNNSCFPRSDVYSIFGHARLSEIGEELYVTRSILFFRDRGPVVATVCVFGTPLCPHVFAPYSAGNCTDWVRTGDRFMNGTFLCTAVSPYWIRNGRLVEEHTSPGYMASCRKYCPQLVGSLPLYRGN